MKKVQRILCVVLCLTVFAAFVASSVLAFVSRHHACPEEDCTICAEIAQLRRNESSSVSAKLCSFYGYLMCVPHVSLSSDFTAVESNTLHDLGVMLTI